MARNDNSSLSSPGDIELCTALNAGSGGERPMAMKNMFYSRSGLEGVDILVVVLFVVSENYQGYERPKRS